jgi:hypothetical protein
MSGQPLMKCAVGVCLYGFFVTVSQGQSLTVSVGNPTQTIATNQNYLVSMTLTTTSGWYDTAVAPSANSTCAGGWWSISPNYQSNGLFYLPTGAATYSVTFSGAPISTPGNCTVTFTFQNAYTNVVYASANASILLQKPTITLSVNPPSSLVVPTNAPYTLA